MKISRRMNLFSILALTFIFSLACSLMPSGNFSLPGIFSSPTPYTSPISPLAGEWVVKSEIGKVSFSIDPSGSRVTVFKVNISYLHCGVDLLSASLTGYSPRWDVENGAIALNASIDKTATLHFNGKYDEKAGKFQGAWRINHLCTGTWEASKK